MTQPDLLAGPSALDVLRETIEDQPAAAGLAQVAEQLAEMPAELRPEALAASLFTSREAAPVTGLGGASTPPPVDADVAAAEALSPEQLARIAQDSAPANDSPFKNALALRLEFSSFGTARKGRISEIKTEADKALLRLGKAIIVSEALDAIGRADRELREWVAARSVEAPLFRAGTRLVKLAMFDQVNTRVLEYINVERPRLVDTFIQDWPRAKDDAIRRLGPQYEARNYPPIEQVRECFRARRNWLEIGAPKALQQLDAQQYQRQAAELKESFRESMEMARAAVREKVRDLIERLSERLSGKDTKTGKNKIFRDSAVENIREFFDLFDACDLTDDQATRAIVDRGRQMLAGVDAQSLRDGDDGYRESMARQFGKMAAELEALIVAAPARAYGEDY